MKKETSSEEDDDCVKCVSVKLALNKKEDQYITLKEKYKTQRMKLKLFNQKIQEVKWKIEEMHRGNDPHTLTFDTSVDLTISEDDAEFSDEDE